MKRIYIHGLGQTAHSWDKVIEASDNRDGIACPDLPGLIGDKEEVPTVTRLLKPELIVRDSTLSVDR